MALIKYGLGVTQMSGSVGGVTAARNRNGNYFRARTKPVNPNSTSQVFARSIIGTLSQAWRTDLTAAKRIAWNSYANAVAMKNKLGEVTYLSGFNHFVRSNAVLLQSGKGLISAGPTVMALPEKDPTLAVAGSVATQKLTLTVDAGQPWALEANAFLQVEQGSPQNETRNFFAGPWKYCGEIPQAAPLVLTLDAVYTLVLGQKTWIACRIVRADGRVSEVMYASCIVAA
jgi:hypothetical protein